MNFNLDGENFITQIDIREFADLHAKGMLTEAKAEVDAPISDTPKGKQYTRAIYDKYTGQQCGEETCEIPTLDELIKSRDLTQKDLDALDYAIKLQ